MERNDGIKVPESFTESDLVQLLELDEHDESKAKTPPTIQSPACWEARIECNRPSYVETDSKKGCFIPHRSKPPDVDTLLGELKFQDDESDSEQHLSLEPSTLECTHGTPHGEQPLIFEPLELESGCGTPLDDVKLSFEPLAIESNREMPTQPELVDYPIHPSHAALNTVPIHKNNSELMDYLIHTSHAALNMVPIQQNNPAFYASMRPHHSDTLGYHSDTLSSCRETHSLFQTGIRANDRYAERRHSNDSYNTERQLKPPAVRRRCALNLMRGESKIDTDFPAKNIYTYNSTAPIVMHKPRDMFAFETKKRKRSIESRGEGQYVEPRDEDVLLGRGGRANKHPGNERYHEEKTMLQPKYKLASKEDKTDISQDLVDIVHSYGGRFLKLDEKLGKWYEVANIVARRKASQALREESTPEYRAAKRAKYPAKSRAKAAKAAREAAREAAKTEKKSKEPPTAKEKEDDE